MKIFNRLKKYKILPHPADLRVKVFGKNKKDLFENAMKAMFESVGYEISAKSVERKINIKSSDLESLLVDFLSEVLYLSLVNKEIYQNINFKKFSEHKIEAKLCGKKIKRFNMEIKGITYHNLEIKKKEDYWQVVILFDI